MKKRHFQYNLFHRLMLTSSITIVLTVVVLIMMISHYYADMIVQRERNINVRILDRMDNYFAHKEQEIDFLMQEIYGERDVISDLTYALNKGYGEYLQYTLDKYATSSSFIPRNLNTYFLNNFNRDQDIFAIRLQSLKVPSIQYSFIYNFTKWHASGIYRDQAEDLESQGRENRLSDIITKTIYLNNPGTLKHMGKLTIYNSTDGLKRIVNQKKRDVPSDFFLLDDKGKVLYTNAASNQMITQKEIPKETDNMMLQVGHDVYFVNSFTNHGYTYISAIPKAQLQSLTYARWTMWLIIILITGIAILINYRFTRHYSMHLGQITKTIETVATGDMTVRIPKQKKADELAMIGDSFNDMLDELQQYMETFYRLNKMQKQAELKALQAQINPHFLFNTLEIIRMVAVVEGSKTSSKMVVHLSKILRYSLDSRESVTVETEILNIQEYLTLIQLQHPNKLDVDLQIGQGTKQILVQKLLLQPLVENYIVHGFKKENSDNKLLLQAEQKDGWLIITIQDNGHGIIPEKREFIQEHLNDEEDTINGSLGLKNVHQRLQLKYGPDSGITIFDNQFGGTTVQLMMNLGGVSNV